MCESNRESGGLNVESCVRLEIVVSPSRRWTCRGGLQVECCAHGSSRLEPSRSPIANLKPRPHLACYVVAFGNRAKTSSLSLPVSHLRWLEAAIVDTDVV